MRGGGGLRGFSNKRWKSGQVRRQGVGGGQAQKLFPQGKEKPAEGGMREEDELLREKKELPLGSVGKGSGR